MKSINVTLTAKAHETLKQITAKEKKNQSEVVSELLENYMEK